MHLNIIQTQLTVQTAKAAATSDSKENVPGKPLGPPPRPSQNGKDGDYFSQHPYQHEPNPFEEQFGNTSGDTPGKTMLPSVAALTSPSALLPNDTPGWTSLRSGPLSPAMLAGPANTDYFDSNYSRGFPTPNESGLRTGLTPGGGGSMFPAPSPNSSALFNSLLGAQTPNTIDFLKTGMNAKSATGATNGNAPTSQPTDTASTKSMDLTLPASADTPNEQFVHPDTDAANGLFMLAQSNGAQRTAGFAVPQVPALQVNGNRARKPSPDMDEPMTSDSDDSSTEPETPKRGTRSRGKKNDKGKSSSSASKTPSNKRKRGSSLDMNDSPPPSSGKKEKGHMTEEEKRKNFLERNRYAYFAHFGCSTDKYQSCSTQVSTTQEAMAQQSSAKG
jgi:ATF/CREB family transcription factor